MKKLIISSLLLLVLLTVGYVYQPKTQPISDQKVGDSRDMHGCLLSAGYQFSKIRIDCVRIFETGISMNPVKKGLDISLSAFVIFKSEEGVGDAEIFIPRVSDSVVLAKLPNNGAGLWGNDMYKLSQWKGVYTIENKSGETLYQGSK